MTASGVAGVAADACGGVEGRTKRTIGGKVKHVAYEGTHVLILAG